MFSSLLRLTQPAAGWAQVGFSPGADLPLEVSRTPWFASPEVRAELGLNDDQQALLNARYGELWKRYNKEYRFFGTPLTEGERLRHEGLSEVNDRFATDFTKNVDEVLADRALRSRYDQLQRQYLGYDALFSPTVQRELRLTATQQQQLRDYRREWSDELARVRKSSSTDRAVAMRDLKHARRQIRERIEETLTPAQRRLWADMTGKPYEFPGESYLPEHPAPRQ